MKESSSNRPDAARRVRRVLLGIAMQAVADLSRVRRSPESGIHALRRRMKKLRSMLRLVRRCVPAEDDRRIRRCADLLKDAFAARRDEDVMRAVMAKIGIDPEAVSFPSAGRSAGAKAGVRHKAAASKLRELILHLTLDGWSWKQAAKSFQRSWKKEQDAWRAAIEDPSPETLHAWRKKTKTLYYQMLFIHGITGRMARDLRLAERLGSLLGRHHDLDVLAACVVPGARSGRWMKRIEARQRELRRRIFKTAGKFHEARPTRSAGRLARRLSSCGGL